MAGEFLSAAERERLNRFPTDIPKEDLIAYFTLTPADMNQIPVKSAMHNRLGFAMQLCALRYLGFSPDNMDTAPPSVVAFVGRQVGVEPDALAAYGDRPQTRSEHLLEIMAYLGFRRVSADDLNELSKWLLERALEHTRPTLLFQLASEKLKAEKIVRPGVTRLEQMVITVRNEAQKEIYRRLSGFEGQTKLDELLLPDESKGCTPLVWLRRGATSNSPNAILEALEKIAYLRQIGVESWDLTVLNPNRLKVLAQLGRKATNQALQRTPEERRSPILTGFLKQSLVDITDEAIEMYDRCLWEAYARAGHDLKDFRESVARTTNEKVKLFRDIGHIILDPDVADAELRKAIYASVPPEMLRTEVEECNEIIRPPDDNYFDFMENRYGYIRRFAPAFLQKICPCFSQDIQFSFESWTA